LVTGMMPRENDDDDDGGGDGGGWRGPYIGHPPQIAHENMNVRSDPVWNEKKTKKQKNCHQSKSRKMLLKESWSAFFW